MNIERLRDFLIASNQAGYAGGEEKKWIKESDGSTTIPYEKGLWRSHDNFFGGEPYGGRTVVFHEGKPVWIMLYYGWVIEGVDTNLVYGILRKALMKMPEDHPYRGPKKLVDGDLTYTNRWSGELERFSGQEEITQDDKLVYKANYMGGWIDRRRGV